MTHTMTHTPLTQFTHTPTTNILAAREKTHGDYDNTARTAQGIKDIMHHATNWERLVPIQREALESMAMKIARIMCGDCNEPEHWADIGGYAELVRMRLVPDAPPAPIAQVPFTPPAIIPYKIDIEGAITSIVKERAQERENMYKVMPARLQGETQ